MPLLLMESPMYQRFKSSLTKIIDAFLVIDLLLMVFFVFLGIIMRYVLKKPLVWGEEVALLGQIWLTLISVGVLCCKVDHMVVDYISSHLSLKKKLILDIVNHSLITIFFLVMTYSGTVVVDMTRKSITPGLGISVSYMYLPTVIGGVLAIFFSVDLLVSACIELRSLKSLETPREAN